ncbi:MAG: substrate-binding domain-containing protein [Cyclobacteriaceae bacterium]
MMRKIRVGGVPEHFNLPWHLAEERGAFDSADIDFEWIFYKGGTGAMTKALRDGEVDMCILLTEGIIKDIFNGNPSTIISKYIKTPLLWGIHTGADNSLSDHKDIYDKQYAISRIGSGSHLMAQVDAFYQGKELDENQFSIINTLDGALTSLAKNETDVFYWEKFTTKPYVDRGALKRIGEYPTPWPCFVIAATNSIISSDPQLIRDTLAVIFETNRSFMSDPSTVQLVSERYAQKVADVAEWFTSTEWAVKDTIEKEAIDKVVYTLKKANVIENEKSLPYDRLVKQLF